jgi:tetratricopeptide (TPR) repeat protein
MQTNLKSVSFGHMKNQVRTALLIIVVLITACSNNKENSPYSNIYSLPELSKISDSISRFPKNDELYYRRANLVLVVNDNYTDAALYDLKKAWGLKQTADYAIDLGYLLQKKNADTAITFLKAARKKFATSAELGFCLADAYLKSNKPDLALAEVNAVLATDSANKYFLERKVSVLLKMDKKTEAIAILEMLFADGNKYVGADLAFLLAETKNPKALAIADEMIKADSAQERAEPYYFKGVYYYNTGDKLRAIEFFNRAIQNDKYFMDAWIEKGKTQFELKQTADAKSTFDKIVQISPDYADAFYWLGKCEEAAGNKAEAKLNYQKAYALDKALTEAKEAAAKIK